MNLVTIQGRTVGGTGLVLPGMSLDFFVDIILNNKEGICRVYIFFLE